MRKTTLTGFVGSTPEKRTNAKGKTIYTFRVASHEYSTKVEGGRDTYWFTLQCEEKFKNIVECFKKGDFIEADGRYEDEIWYRKTDDKWETHRILLVDSISFGAKCDKSKKKKKNEPKTAENREEYPF